MGREHVECSRCKGRGWVDVGAEGGWYFSEAEGRKIYPKPGEYKTECQTCKGNRTVYMGPKVREDGTYDHSIADQMNGRKYM